MMQIQQLLIIGHTYPESRTTGAGVRMVELIRALKGWTKQITFATTATPSERFIPSDLEGVEVHQIELNSTSFDYWVKELAPELVLFDRFMTEEQFGWRVAENCPQAIRVLDTEDLHFLRDARKELALTKQKGDLNLQSDLAIRELASMYRSDLSLIISEAEYELLTNEFQIPPQLLHYLPFLVSNDELKEKSKVNDYQQRSDFITVGNFKHQPNVDGVKWLKSAIWPAIRARIPEAQLHVYGAYAGAEFQRMHDPENGFHLHGWIQDLEAEMQKARLCLAPLRFGAGLKTKLFSAMKQGTPIVTTAVGAEGINGSMPFPGVVADEVDEIVSQAVNLYQDETPWLQAQTNGFELLKTRFNATSHKDKLHQVLYQLSENLSNHRSRNFVGQMLQHQTMAATRYMSKWIEAKNKS